jgi:probable HAF family extracellular repeat protein
MRTRVCWIMSVVCLTIFCLAGNLGATVYKYQDLTAQGFPTVGYWDGHIVTGINDAKQIVGYYHEYISPVSTYRAFIWDPVNGYTELQPQNNYSQAFGINKHGQVVGQSGGRACLWSNPSQLAIDLTGGGGGGYDSFAYAINDNGLMVGVYGGYSTSHAYKWTGPMPGGGTDLGTLGGSTSLANSVNNAGQIVGIARNSQEHIRACLWNPGQPGEDLLPSLPLDASVEQCFINNQGNVTGDAFPGPKAFYRDYKTQEWVNNIAPQWAQSQPVGLSDANQVIGWGYNPGEKMLFWNPTQGTQDLNQLVLKMPQGVTIVRLIAISPQGHIVGVDSQEHVCLLSPIPVLTPVYSLLLLN